MRTQVSLVAALACITLAAAGKVQIRKFANVNRRDGHYEEPYAAPAPIYEAPYDTYGPPAVYEAPTETYGPPPPVYETPIESYGPPAYEAPVDTYGPPAVYETPVDTYGPPAYETPIDTYGLPDVYEEPKSIYGVPKPAVYAPSHGYHKVPLKKFAKPLVWAKILKLPLLAAKSLALLKLKKAAIF